MNARAFFIMLIFMLLAALSLGCGAQQAPHNWTCVDIHESCLHYSNQTSGNPLTYFAFVWQCEEDYGNCLAVRTADTCAEGCADSSIRSVCTWACLDNRREMGLP